MLPAATSAKSASSDVSGPSFNQFLSKEISSPKNNNGNTSNAGNTNNNSNNVNNNANNNNNANKQVDNQAADKPAQAEASTKTDKPKETDKEEQSDSEQADQTGDQSAGAQLIALVENLGKLTVDKAQAGGDKTDGKQDLSTVAAAGPRAIAADASLQLSAADAAAAAAAKIAAGDGKAAAEVNPDAKTDAKDAIGKELDSAQLADKGEAKDKTGSGTERDFAAAIKDANSSAKDNTQQARNPAAEMAAGTDRKLEAAQELASAKALLTDKIQGDAAVAPVPQTFAQQLAANATQANAGAAAEHLSPRVGTPGWDQAVGQKVVWMVAGGKQTAELTLNPPDLGPMQVVLSVNNDKATATFVTAQPEVRDALESALPKLRQMMSDAGVQLSGFSVSTQSSNQGNQQFAGDNSSSGSGRFSPALADADISPVQATISSSRAGRLGMVDTFA